MKKLGVARSRVAAALLFLTAGLGVGNLRLAYLIQASEQLRLDLELQIAEERFHQQMALDNFWTSLETPERMFFNQTLQALRQADSTSALYIGPNGSVGKVHSDSRESTSLET